MTRWLRGIGLTAAAFAMLYPFLWMASTSLKSLQGASRASVRLWPGEWLWSNYETAWNAAPFGRYFFNTFLVAGVVTAGVVLTSLFAGYAFARMRFRGAGVCFALVLATMMVPFEIVLIPNFVLITKLGWYNTYAALIVPWCANGFSIFLMRQAFAQVPRDYFDAAVMDGCGHVQMLWRVGMPLVRPALFTVALFAFLGSYNALVWPLVVTSEEHMRMVQVGLTVFALEEGVRVPLLMCAAVIVMLPTLGLYFLAQRHFRETAYGAGIKG
jgi:multiple sugar transport system permease protein